MLALIKFLSLSNPSQPCSVHFPSCLCRQRGTNKDPSVWLDGARPLPKYIYINNIISTNSGTTSNFFNVMIICLVAIDKGHCHIWPNDTVPNDTQHKLKCECHYSIHHYTDAKCHNDKCHCDTCHYDKCNYFE